MSTLTGKAFYGTPTGHVTVNGKPGSLRRFKRVMGFVPQVRVPGRKPGVVSALHTQHLPRSMHAVQDLPELSVAVLGAKVAGWLATADLALLQLPSRHLATHPPGQATLLHTVLLQAAVHGVSTAKHCSIHRTAHIQLTPLHSLQDDIMYPMLTVEENLTFSARIRLPADFTHGQHLHHVEQAIQVGPGLHAAACLWACSPLGYCRHGWRGWRTSGHVSAAQRKNWDGVPMSRCCA